MTAGSFDEADVSAEIAQTERIGLGDLAIAAVLGVSTWVLLALWEFPGLHPAVWTDAAVASGVRPAVHVMPGYFTAFASAVYSVLGIGAGHAALRVLGHAALAATAVVMYAALREMLAFVMRARPQRSKRRTFVMQVASVVGTAAFVCTDPVWTAGQCLSETTVLILLTLVATEMFFLFLRKGTLKYAYLAAVLLGLLCAESPMGFILVAAFISVNFLVLKVLPVLESPFFRPEVIAVGKWYVTFIFIAAFVAGVALNCCMYAACGGLDAIGETAGSMPLAYLLGYWGRIVGAAGPTGWVLLLGACVTPFVVTVVRFPSAADEEVFLPYSTGMVFLFCGLVAFLPCTPVSELWFWTYGAVDSPYLLSMGLLLGATTLAGAVTILGVDSLCRNHQRLAMQQFGVDDDDASGAIQSRLSTAIRRAGMVVVPLALLLAMLPGRVKTVTRAMLSVIADSVAEMVRECGDAKYVFTDGNLDTALELESAKTGGALKCLSLVGGPGAYAVHLRTRGMAADPEDMFSFKYDAAMGLRTWIRDKPARLATCAAQMGFDLWKRDGRQIPPMGGLVSRPAGWADDSVRLAGVERAKALASRVKTVLSAPGGTGDCTDALVRNIFSFVQWRISRMCTYRSERADYAGDAAAAIAEAELAKSLNDSNESYQQMIAALLRQNDQMLQQLTPREGLQLALVRADFRMGKVYSETILGSDPDNPDANFAMGMYYLGERQLARAEEYLKRCLIRRPGEPAVYNNIAMVQLELGKLDAAALNAEKALKLVPESAAVRDTIKAIEEARAGRPRARSGAKPAGKGR